MKQFLTLILALVAFTHIAFPRVAKADVESDLTDAVRAAVKVAAPSVLRIETFGGLEKVGDVLVSSGPSTGLVLSEDGFVLCSAYSFAQQPTSVLVTLPSGKRAAAEVVARDHSRMLVLLKVNTEERLTPPQLVARKDMQVGQSVIALGRTFDAKSPNVSVGILSATHRIWDKAIQTDAKISPSNYGGPLIDLHGRVLGVLVPMSPQGEGALAGAEWYDSGIGFAVPLAEMTTHLEKLKQGIDLHAGKLGVSLAGKDDFSGPVKVAAVQPGSPAANAGLKKEDIIVAVDDRKVRWLAHLKHALGPRYAGESVNVEYTRDKMTESVIVELVGDIPAYDVPFFGILPLRTSAEGVTVRYVYPASPAAKAGIATGDVITQSADVKINSADQLRTIVGTHDAKEGELSLTVTTGGKSRTVKVALASLPEDVPDKLPAPAGELADAEKTPTGLVEIELPEIANNCFAYIPESYHADVPHGVLVWLQAPGKFDKEAIEGDWQDVCNQHNLIVIAPQAANENAWQPTEAEFVRKAIDEVTDSYNVDSARVVLGGFQAGGTFASLVAFGNSDVARGIAMFDAALPARAAIPASDPLTRTAFFVSPATESKLTERIEQGIERLRENKLPVTVKPLGDQAAAPGAKLRDTLARWIDTLDRI